QKSAYYRLVMAQQMAAGKNDRDAEELARTEIIESQLDRRMTREKGDAFEVGLDGANLANKLNRSTTWKSLSSLVIQKKQGLAAKQYSLWTLIKLVGSFNRKEWHF